MKTRTLCCIAALSLLLLSSTSGYAQTEDPVKALVGQLSPGKTAAAVQARIALERMIASAGKPGADAERTAMSAALAQCLTGDYPEEARREVLILLGWTAGDAEIPAIAALLPDPVLGESARGCLERIPGDKASLALLEGLTTTKDEMRQLIAGSLGRRKAYGLGPALAERARQEDQVKQWPYAEALAKLGIPPMSLGNPTGNQSIFGGQQSYINTAITAAEVCASQDDAKKATQICMYVARLNPAPPETARMLRALARAKAAELPRFALGYMDIPGVRSVAIEALATADAPDLEANLEKAYYVVDLSRRVAIIDVFARRKSPLLAPILEKGATDSIAEIRIAVAKAKGEKPNPDDLYLAATKGLIWMRVEAMDQYLTAAEDVAAGGDPATAVPMFEKAVKSGAPAILRSRAIDGLARYAGKDSLGLIVECQGDPLLKASAKNAEAAIKAR